ncbi:MAG: helix-turn-helix transcriptional regulator [Bradyrhizobium sp.]|nr:helix-turn-helix transcriptional regulator [Bradyrhizobium sp.]
MVAVGREDPCSLALTLRLACRLRGMKQAHAAELLGVTQPTVSRIERGELKPAGILRSRLLDLVSAHIHPARDAALRRLIENSASPVHLVCDLTHRLLAASGPREREWRCAATELRGQPPWRYASEAIRTAEARLPSLGWGERDGTHALTFTTGANGLDELRIAPGVLIWERILLSDGSPARLVTRVGTGAGDGGEPELGLYLMRGGDRWAAPSSSDDTEAGHDAHRDVAVPVRRTARLAASLPPGSRRPQIRYPR